MEKLNLSRSADIQSVIGGWPLSSASEFAVLVASAEFTLKSSPVRRTLEQRLVDDLRFALARDGFDDFLVEKHAARIVIRGLRDPVSAAGVCARVFGVAYAAPAVLVPSSMEPIIQAIIALAEQALASGQSFAIRSHRSTSGPVSRRDVEVRGGSEVLQALKDRAVRVNLKQPDLTIFVDLAGDRAYVYRTKLQGPGGLPLSSQWRMLAILDSGPLTILAAYAMMRRGCLVELFIPLSEAVPSFARDYQLNLARKLRGFVTRTKFRAFTFQLDDLLGDGAAGFSPGYSHLKHLVRLAGIRFAREKRFKGVVFSDVVGEIRATQKAPVGLTSEQLPVFQPLIGLDRDDLVEMCQQTQTPEEELFSQMKLEQNEYHISDPLLLRKDLSEALVQELSL